MFRLRPFLSAQITDSSETDFRIPSDHELIQD